MTGEDADLARMTHILRQVSEQGTGLPSTSRKQRRAAARTALKRARAAEHEDRVTSAHAAALIDMNPGHFDLLLDRAVIPSQGTGSDRTVAMRDLAAFVQQHAGDNRELAARFSSQARTRDSATNELDAEPSNQI